VATGEVLLGDQLLQAGDGAALEKEDGFVLTSKEPAEVLAFDIG
jgi:hypothetical protein